MGDRISFSFQNNNKESVSLFSHWQGKSFITKAEKYLTDLKNELKNKDQEMSTPLTRLEPNTVMIDFIREITKEEKRIDSDLYLGKDEEDGDNSDNGHFKIDVNS